MRWLCVFTAMVGLFAATSSALAAPPSAEPKAPRGEVVSLPDLYAYLQENFGLRAKIPEGYPACRGYYYQSTHGFWTMLDGSKCELGGPRADRVKHPTMGVSANFNALDEPDALSYAKGGSCAAPHWADADWLWSIDGLKTAACQDEQSDGSVTIYLTAMGGRSAGAKAAVPSVAYEATLSTTRTRLAADIEPFRRFVASIEVSELCLRGQPRAWLQPCRPNDSAR